MGSNSNHHDDPCIQLLGPNGIQENWDSKGDGSNAILLPGKKKKSKSKGGKASNKNKSKQQPPMSKSNQRKQKQLQEEKEKKLLHSKSIRLLEKYKIWDGAYSLLHPSGTIGKVETLREKRRRAVQLSKAGLEVMEDVTPFKKKSKHNDARENEDNLKLDSDQSHLEHKRPSNDLMLVEHKEGDNCNLNESSKTSLKPACMSPPPDLGRLHSTEIKDKDNYICKLDNQKKNDLSKRQNLDSQRHDSLTVTDQKEPEPLAGKGTNWIEEQCEIGLRSSSSASAIGVDGSNISCQNTKVPVDYIVQEHVNGPIVVHVSRPNEVEEKRRDLPIIMMEQEIMEAINEHSIVILCGETGCGKTTQVPQFLYEAGFGSRNYSDRKGIIGVTQPRRVAVLATAKRVSFELGLHLGKEVGFQVRHDKMIGDGCSIKFMTDGILLREVQSDFLLKRYSVIILDEAHERSLSTDILIGMLSRIIKLRKKLYVEQQEKMLSGERISPENIIYQLKLVLMSATLQVDDFISDGKLFHKTTPVLEVPVRQFPVTIHFSKRTQEDYLGQAYKKVMSIHKRLPQGGILVFVTGQREVEFLCKKLRKASRQLSENDSERKEDNEMNASLEVDIKDIDEAFMSGGFPVEQIDRFSSYEEDYENAGMDSYSSDSESESMMESDSEGEDMGKAENPEKSGLVLDFLKNSESLYSLKASFEALAGNLSVTNCSDKPSLPVAPTTKECTEPTARSPGALYVLPLYAMLPASAQLRIFEEIPEGERLVVVATNVAETSLTIPGIKYVVDTGKVKAKNYSYTNGMATYEVQWISKASAAQRAGRAGRTGPGHCYRLYSSAAFSKDDMFPEFSCPEISKIPVDGVVLLMKFMGIDKVANFPFPTRPQHEALVEAEHCLKVLEALDSHGRLTPIGRAMAQYPMSPRHSRMLLTFIWIMRNQQGYARANFLLGYAVATAAVLSFSNPFNMQLEGNNGAQDDMDGEERHDHEGLQDQQERQRRKKMKALAKEVRSRFCNPSSDALSVAYALQLFELAEKPVEFCSTNSLHFKTMEEMSKLRKQLLELIFHQSKVCQEFSWNNGTFEDVELSWRKYSNKHPLKLNEEELLGQAICAGWADRVAKRIRRVPASSEKDHKVRAARYQSCALKDAVYIHRWSSLSQSAPEFLVYAEILCTKRPYMHGATSVKPDWLIKYASSLCIFSAPLTDPKPYYEPLSDQVLCWVSATFGQHNWQLPLHSLPMKNDSLRVSVFACALLEGYVLPCLRSAQKFLAAPPSRILRPGALGQKRVGDLLNGLKIGSRAIDSRVMLREAWNVAPQLLYVEILNWFQQGFHDQFRGLWEQMHSEVLQDGYKLFPKRAKKDRKKVK